MAVQTIEYLTIGWDAGTQRPVCSVWLAYDDSTLALVSVRVVNASDDTSVSFVLTDHARAPGHPRRETTLTITPGRDETAAPRGLTVTRDETDALVVPGYSLHVTGPPTRTDPRRVR